jgi:hypothetical protein
MVSTVGNYMLIVVCAVFINRFVRQHYAGPNDASRLKLHRQMSLNLFIQAIE